MAFRKGFQRLLPAPLQGNIASRFAYAATSMLSDVITHRLWRGVEARFAKTAPTDALPELGKDRRILRGLEESETSYRGRLKPFLDTWRTAGTAKTILEQLRTELPAAYAAPVRIVDHAGTWHTLSGLGAYTREPLANWTWDTNAGQWARFWTVLYTQFNNPWTRDTWDNTATWGDGGTWGSDMSAAQAAAFKRAVRHWMPAHAEDPWIIVTWNGDSFNPVTPTATSVYGNWSIGGNGTRSASRTNDATYMRG